MPAPHHVVRRRLSRVDALTFLTLYLVLLFAIPSRLVFGPLGGAGSPAQLFGLAGLVWWLWERLNSSRQVTARHPVRTTALLFTASIGASFVAAMVRPINGEEANAAMLGLVSIAGLMGVLLIAHDGLSGRRQYFRLFHRIAFLGAALAACGIFQFLTGEAWVEYIRIPGLTENIQILGAATREGFTRPAGTAVHPIEFGAVLTMVLPISIASAFIRRSSNLLIRWLPAGLVGLAIVLSISRSAIVGAIIGGALLVPGLPRRARWMSLLFAPIIVIFVFLAIPGMVGTITGLFSSIGSDSSAQSRTDSYPIAFEFFNRYPLFGRGFTTFQPSYRIFDNQYLLFLVEIGSIGVLAMLALAVSVVVAALRTRRLSISADMRLASQALLASAVAGSCSLALFDTFSFPMASGILVLIFGVVGGGYRIVQLQPDHREQSVVSSRRKSLTTTAL